MKRWIAIWLFVNAVLLAMVVVFLWKERTEVAHAADGGGFSVRNGDVNGDGTIDISDAVYLLSSLFLGGSAPVAIECPTPTKGILPATGQAKCFDAAVIEIDCMSTDFPGQDGFYKAGCPREGRFVDNGDGTVTDNCTGLMWQKDTADIDGNGSIGVEDHLRWPDALKYCEALAFAGHADWRLPNVQELQSIVDYGRFDPSIDPVFGAFSTDYWSSTTFASMTGPILVHFGIGLVFYGTEDSRPFVRAVRSVQ